MAKPAEEELEKALAQAKHMRESNQDPHFLGKALLNHHYRLGYLLDIFHIAERYMRGMSEQDHTRLQIAIDKARREEARVANDEVEGFGL